MALDSLLDPSTADINCSDGSMGMSWGMQADLFTPRKKNRWILRIPDISASATPALPPKKSARPSISLKEFEFHHVNETIWFPMRPEWKPINVVLYDVACDVNPVFSWLQSIYDPTPNGGEFQFPTDIKVSEVLLQLYDGCGNILEQWTYENAYPSEINWGELEMESADLVVVEFTMRYDRAWVVDGDGVTPSALTVQ